MKLCILTQQSPMFQSTLQLKKQTKLQIMLESIESKPSLQVLDQDKNSPDAHVPRDARMIRLTGSHPFNAEAPLSDLFNSGNIVVFLIDTC